MKKIAIITFHASNNCGSMLQAYALQKTIDEISETNSEIINFSNKSQQQIYNIFATPNSLKLIARNIISSFFYNILKKERDDYNQFRERYFNLTDESFQTNRDLKSIENKYTHWICGSDQIWNICCGDADDAYFLNFAKSGKLIAYAPSLGAVNIEEKAKDKQKYIDYLQRFDILSVREQNAVGQIEKLSGKKVEMLIDPTLLLNKEEWETIIGDRIVKEPYIFYYAFHYTKEVNKSVNEISKRLKKKVIILDARAWSVKAKCLNGYKLSERFGPEAFLNLVKYADLVLTTSFHGTVFSVIFEKPFWYVNSSYRNPKDDRAFSLLNQIGLLERLKTGEEIIKNGIFSSINYLEVKKTINNLQNEALVFLKKAVDE